MGERRNGGRRMLARRSSLAAMAILASGIGVAQCFSPTSLSSFTRPAALSRMAVVPDKSSGGDDSDSAPQQQQSGEGVSSSSSSSNNLLYGLDRRSAMVGAGSAAAAMLLSGSASAASSSSANNGRIPEWTLGGGVRFPTLALNTVGLSAEDAERALRIASKEGVTHVDFHPGKERDGVARYIASSGRAGLFLNTKIRKAPPGTSPEEAADRARAQIDDDLKALGVDGVDMLMLRDSPDCSVIQAQWAVLEEALRTGKTRSVGVINFCEAALRCVLETAKVKPALNYYMLHVGMGPDAHGLRTFGESRGIRTFAYGAVGEPGPSEELLSSPVLRKVGEAHKRSPEEVALRWVLQSGAAVSVRPTTDFGLGVSTCAEGAKCEEGMKARAQSFGWSLTKAEMAELSKMKGPDANPTLFSSSGCPGAFVMPK